jgi:uncharacterized membrane protein YfcA
LTPDSSHLVAGLGTGVCGGFLSGLFGVGGGIVMVPLLGLALNLDQHRAQGATLAAMLLPTGLPAVLQYRKRGIASSVKLVGVLILAFLFGVYAGAMVANRIPSTPLKWTYASFLFFLAIRTWMRHEPPGVDRGEEPFDLSGLWTWGLVIGLLGGFWSGLTGLGGSVVMIPLLASRFRMTQHEAQLTSLMMLLPPIGLPGVYVYAQAQGGLPWVVILCVAAGFAVGALAGAHVATRLASARLKHAFGWIVLLMALLVLVRKS